MQPLGSDAAVKPDILCRILVIVTVGVGWLVLRLLGALLQARGPPRLTCPECHRCAPLRAKAARARLNPR